MKLYHHAHKISKFSQNFSTCANPKTTGALRTLGTRRYTTYGDTAVPVVVVRRANVAREEEQVVGAGRRAGDRGPVVPAVARAVQVASRGDEARADKEQRSSGNGISATASRASKTVLIKEVIETTRNIIIVSMA